MDGIDKRAMVRDRARALTGLSRRVTLLISNSAAPKTNNVDPYANVPNGSNDTKHIIRAVFTEMKSQRVTDTVGRVTKRKAKLDVHNNFRQHVLSAYACTVEREVGRWEIVGTPEKLGDTFFTVYLSSMD